MISPDLAVAHFMSAHSHRSWTLDAVIVTLADNEFVKGLVLVLFWWTWTSRAPGQQHRRRIILATLPAPFLAFFSGRLLSHLLPFRLRPIADPALHWRLAEGLPPALWARTWSSLPSDHAACFAAIAFSLFLVSRRAGFIALAYTFVMVDLPRIYLGLHYLSDIVLGSLIGLVVAAILASRPLSALTVPPMLRLQRARPALFYSFLFVCLYTVGCINSVHALMQLTSTSVKAWSHHLPLANTSAESKPSREIPLSVIILSSQDPASRAPAAPIR